MEENTLRVLEFYKVRESLAEHASSGPGRDEAMKLVPSADPKAVLRALRETNELKSYLEHRNDFPISGLRDISGHLKKAAVEGAVLRPEDLLEVMSVARASRLVKSALGKARQEFALLAERSVGLGMYEILEHEIGKAISEEGEVLDTASFELKRIRRMLQQMRHRINKELEGIINSPSYSKAVQEPVITVRGDRYVIPLKPNFKAYLSGIVHDQSASGSTVFVEPQSTVELNNKLTQLRVDEKREIERVLYQLTASVRGSVEGLTQSYHALVGLDVLYAKAGYALSIGANMPALVEGGVIDLRQARHPLLIKIKGMQATVPLDVKIGRDFRVLVITGPNTGGKTVTLKTVGLLALMAQAGMLIPAAPDSAISVFSGVFSDIGDEQSVEQNLSTFSSHISRIVGVLKVADRGSLVLLDELGAGTDPVEGSALGVAILEDLHKRGTRVVVTTHHGALKVFAANTPGAMNASVEFDAGSLQPTYRLLVGAPGRSNALVVAKRLGMPQSVIDSAEHTRGADAAELDRLIEKLEREAAAAREDRRKAAQETELARAEKDRLAELVKRAEVDRREAVLKAQEKATGIITSLRSKLRELEEMAKRTAKAPETAPERAEVRKRAEEVRTLEAQLKTAEVRHSEHKKTDIAALSAGQVVRVYKYNKMGTILAIKKEKGQVIVQIDALKVTLGPDELEPVAGKQSARPEPKKAYQAGVTFSRESGEDEYESEGPGIELNIIGLRAEVAAERVEKFIDQCLLSGIGSVRIIHGRGTGALRRTVTEIVKANRAVTNFHQADFQEGGDAVMIVEFR
jgi:DNA mismatch repair protein MutS2